MPEDWQMLTNKLPNHTPHHCRGKAAQDIRICLRRWHTNVRDIKLEDAREELLGLTPKGAKGGETNREEVVGRTSTSMLVTLALLKTCKSRGGISPSTWRHTNQIHTTVGVTMARVKEDIRETSHT